MQHVLRCWDRQSDGTEYKKTLRRPGLCPGPRRGSLSLPQTPYLLGSPPQEAHPRSLPFSGLLQLAFLPSYRYSPSDAEHHVLVLQSPGMHMAKQR